MSNEELVATIQQGDRAKLLELWNQVERFVRWKAGKWQLGNCCSVDVEDLYQSGYPALLEAVETFDACKEMSFVGWYGFYLKTAFLETCGLRTTRQREDPIHKAFSIDMQLAQEDSFTIADIVSDPTAEYAFVEVEEKDRVARLYAALDTTLEALPDAERCVLRARYYQDRTLESIGAEMQVSRERVRQIEGRGLRMLRHPKNNREVRKHL